MPADSPENKCPDECPECGSEKRWPPPVWTDGESGVTEECWHPWHEKPRCPDCGGSGANEFGDAFNNPCQTCGGSGRINTSGDFIGDKPGLGEHSCHEDCPCSPSPDRETGGSEADRLAYSQYQLRSGLRDLIAWNEDVPGAKIQALLDATTPSAPSAAPTNQGPSRSDSEGEGLAARIEAAVLEERSGRDAHWTVLIEAKAQKEEQLAEKDAKASRTTEGDYFKSESFSMRAARHQIRADAFRSLLVPKEEA